MGKEKHMNRFSKLLLVLLLSTPVSSYAAVSLFGYTGVADANGNKLPEIQGAMIHTNVATVDFTEIWTSTNLASITSQYQASGVKAGLFLDNVLFRRFPVTSSPCVDANGPFLWALR